MKLKVRDTYLIYTKMQHTEWQQIAFVTYDLSIAREEAGRQSVNYDLVKVTKNGTTIIFWIAGVERFV
jgi:hypothetical protein